MTPQEKWKKDLSSLNHEEMDNLIKLTKKEEKSLEDCLATVKPISTSDYINIITSIKEENEEDL